MVCPDEILVERLYEVYLSASVDTRVWIEWHEYAGLMVKGALDFDDQGPRDGEWKTISGDFAPRPNRHNFPTEIPC